MDDYLRFNDWKKSPPNAYYDSPLVRRVLRTLKELRGKEDVEGVCAVLHAALRSNFAGVENFRLYRRVLARWVQFDEALTRRH